MFSFYYHYITAEIFLRKSISWEHGRLSEYQNKKLIQVVRHAGRNVPYYRGLFYKIGLDPMKFKGIEDLGKIPLLDKELIRKDPEILCADDYKKYGGSWVKTSGSTGTPLKLRIDSVSKAWKYAAALRAYRMAGYSYYKKSLVVQGYSESKKEPFGFRPVSNSLYYNSSRVNEKTVLDFYPLLMKHRPQILIGYIRPIALMLEILRSRDLELPPVRSLINYGENPREETVSFIKQALDCEIYDFYSLTENMAMIHTFPDGSLRMVEDYFYPEVIFDNESHQTGLTGELIGTSFYNLAMPLIRYRSRDFIVMDDTPDDHPFRKIKSIEGRIDDMIVLPDGSRVTLVEGALGYAKGIVAAQYIQEKPGILGVHVVVDQEFNQEDFKIIEQALAVRLGNTMKYQFKIVKQLETLGREKPPFVINRMKNNS